MTASSIFNSKFSNAAKLRREPPGKTAKRAPVGPIALAARRIEPPQLSSLRLASSYSTFQTIWVSVRWICATVGCGFSIVNIASAIFDCSAPDLDSCPDESLPEFAFIGRSNVGKSSLLNMLAGEQGLARVSPTPGFTKLINIFTVNQCWRLVDLPGYGFAAGAKKDSARFNKAVARYLKHRTNLCLVFVLIESGLSPQEIDVEFVEWLARNAVPFVLV